MKNSEGDRLFATLSLNLKPFLVQRAMLCCVVFLASQVNSQHWIDRRRCRARKPAKSNSEDVHMTILPGRPEPELRVTCLSVFVHETITTSGNISSGSSTSASAAFHKAHLEPPCLCPSCFQLNVSTPGIRQNMCR